MRFRILLFLVVVVSLQSPGFAQKRNITEKDLFNFVWAGDPQVSPDGSRIAFIRVTEKMDTTPLSGWMKLPPE